MEIEREREITIEFTRSVINLYLFLYSHHQSYLHCSHNPTHVHTYKDTVIVVDSESVESGHLTALLLKKHRLLLYFFRNNILVHHLIIPSL
jgi:hypothetical protein